MLALLPWIQAPLALAEEGGPAIVEGTVPVDDVRLYTRTALPVAAPRATLLVVHGGPGVSHDHLQVLETLARTEGVAVVNYDQRGVGRSTAPAAPAGYALDRSLADLDAVRATLGEGPVVVLGHSWGGLVAMVYAARHPDRLDALVLVDPAVPYSRSGLGSRLRMRIAELQLAGNIPDPLPERGAEDCTAWLRAIGPALNADPTVPFSSQGPASTCSTPAHDGSWSQLGDFDYSEETRTITAPVLLVWGREDPYGVDTAAQILRRLPEGTGVAMLDGCGHRPMHECPDAFYGALTPFLRGYGAP